MPDGSQLADRNLLCHRYKDQAAVTFHLNTSYLAELQATEAREGLLREPPLVVFLLDLVTRFIRGPLPTES